MFDIGFSELMLVFVIGLVVLGPKRLPFAVRTVVGWIRVIRSLASTVQNELTQELKLQELQDSLKKAEEASKNNLSTELKVPMEELRKAAESMKKEFKNINSTILDPVEPHTIHNLLVTDSEALPDSVISADGNRQTDTPPMMPVYSVANPATQAASPATKVLAQGGESGSAASVPRSALSTSPLNNDG